MLTKRTILLAALAVASALSFAYCEEGSSTTTTEVLPPSSGSIVAGLVNWGISIGGIVIVSAAGILAYHYYDKKDRLNNGSNVEKAAAKKYLKTAAIQVGSSALFFCVLPILLNLLDSVKPDFCHTFSNGSRSISRTDYYVDILSLSALDAILCKKGWKWHHILLYTVFTLVDEFLPFSIRFYAQCASALVYLIFNFCHQFAPDSTTTYIKDLLEDKLPDSMANAIAYYLKDTKASLHGSILRGLYHLAFPAYFYLRYFSVENSVGLRSITADDYLGMPAMPVLEAVSETLSLPAPTSNEGGESAPASEDASQSTPPPAADATPAAPATPADATPAAEPVEEPTTPQVSESTPAAGSQDTSASKSSASESNSSIESDAEAAKTDAMHTYSLLTVAVAVFGALLI